MQQQIYILCNFLLCFLMVLHQCCTVCQLETSAKNQMLKNKCFAIIITIISYTSCYDEVSSRSILFIYIAEQNNLHRVENFKCSLTLCLAKLPSMLSLLPPCLLQGWLACVNICKNVSRKCLDSKCLKARWLCYTYDLYMRMSELVSINDCIMFQKRELKHWKI